jgi:hypothetical protein
MSELNQTTVGHAPNTSDIDLDALFRGSKVDAFGIYLAGAGVILERLVGIKLAYPMYLLAGLVLDFRTNILKYGMRTKKVVQALKQRIV